MRLRLVLNLTKPILKVFFPLEVLYVQQDLMWSIDANIIFSQLFVKIHVWWKNLKNKKSRGTLTLRLSFITESTQIFSTVSFFLWNFDIQSLTIEMRNFFGCCREWLIEGARCVLQTFFHNLSYLCVLALSPVNLKLSSKFIPFPCWRQRKVNWIHISSWRNLMNPKKKTPAKLGWRLLISCL